MRAYSETYLDDVVESQGKLFDFVAQTFPENDTTDFIEGVINRRENIVPVVNIANKFLLEEKEIDDESRIIIMDMDGEFVGILVDKVIEIIKIDDEEISEPPDISTGIPYEAFIGVYNFNGKMLSIIEAAKVLETEVEENE